MTNSFHTQILEQIKARSGKPTQHTFLDSYLGNDHPRYAINAPALRDIGKTWMRTQRDLTPSQFCTLLDSLIHAPSSTEKVMAGILLDNATAGQRKFDPMIFDKWLDQLVGWAEVDSVCTGKYTIHEVPLAWKKWKKILTRFSKSGNIQKRRASLVFLCSTVRYTNEEDIGKLALENIDRLKGEREVLITKAISWLLRSMIKNYRKEVEAYLKANKETLPAIAVRETITVLKTGKKTS